MAQNQPTKIITHTAVSAKHHTAADVGLWHYQRWGGYSPSTLLPGNDVRRYCGYHIVINWDGTWEQVRNFTDEGIHCKGQNFSSIGVVFMGDGDKHKPSIAQQNAWRNEVWPFILSYYPEILTQQIYPHRKYANKSCHGKLLSDTYYSDLLVIKDDYDYMEAHLEKLRQLVNRLYTLLARERMLK